MNTLIKLYQDNTQEKLAEMLGVSQPTISDWVNGHSIPRVKHCKKIAELARVPFQQVVTEFYQ